jgi:uncharacterized protein
MKRRFAAFLLILSVARFASVHAVGTNATTKPLHALWQVEGKSNVVYLLGSVHLLRESDYPLAAPLESAFTNSQIAVFETDLGRMKLPEIQSMLLRKASLPAGETLKDHLSTQVFSAFQKQVAETGLPPASFDRFKPSLAGVALVVIELQRMGANPESGIDKHFFERAEKTGKRIVPLETVEFQIGLVTDFSEKEGEAFMKSILDQIRDIRKFYNDMVSAWKTGDAARLEKLLNDSMQDEPELYQRFLTDRNRRWVPKIEELLHGNTNAIVIVGAGHLVGSEGVVELLRKKGARVKQL